MRHLLILAAVQDAFVEKHGVKLGFMSAFVKASADALHQVGPCCALSSPAAAVVCCLHGS